VARGTQLAEDPPDDVLLVCPGIVYRRDAIDWQHSPTAIHQGTRHQWAVAQRPRGRDAWAGTGAGRRP
jgi:hypothetical protein